MRDKSPLGKINEIADLTDVNSFFDLLRLRDFVFKLIPWFIEPSDSKLDLTVFNVINLYNQFKCREVGGWCGLNAEYYQFILYWYYIKTRPYNFGLRYKNITHVGVIVEYDGMEFFMDPYFAMHYIHRDGFPLQFKDLMNLISDRKFDRILPVYSDCRKEVQQQDGSFLSTNSTELFRSVLGSWPNYDREMMDVFGMQNPELLMMLKIV
jgi:hypothetical protein